MAKVYDALRRAEEERRRRAGDESSPAEPLDVPSAPPPPRVQRPSLLRSLFSRKRGAPTEGSGAAEINKRRIAVIQPDSYVAEQFRAAEAARAGRIGPSPRGLSPGCFPCGGR